MAVDQAVVDGEGVSGGLTGLACPGRFFEQAPGMRSPRAVVKVSLGVEGGRFGAGAHAGGAVKARNLDGTVNYCRLEVV